jgi:hypothetical protein
MRAVAFEAMVLESGGVRRIAAELSGRHTMMLTADHPMMLKNPRGEERMVIPRSRTSSIVLWGAKHRKGRQQFSRTIGVASSRGQ